MKKFFLFAAAALMALVGCEKQTQSSLDFADVKQEAKITGQLVYYADKAGTATEEVKLANQRVYFQVPVASYAAGAGAFTAIGNKQFEATTDADGNFTIVVPTGGKAVTGDLKTDVIVIGEVPNRIFLNETTKSITLNAGDAKVEKREAKINTTLTSCQGTAILKGNVVYNAGIVDKGGVREEGLTAAPAGLKVSISIKYDDAEKTLIALTKDDGSYMYEVPVYTNKALTAKIDLEQFAAKYTEEQNHQLVAKNAIFGITPVTGVTLSDGKTEIQDLSANLIKKEEPSTKTTKFIVKGELQISVEEMFFKTVKDHENEVDKVDFSTAPYTTKINGGQFQIHLVYNEGKSYENTIIYDCATESEKSGKFTQEVAVYDSCDVTKVKVYLVVKPFVVKDYIHYYQTAKYNNKGEWESFPGVWNVWVSKTKTEDYYDTQKCEGVYELKKSLAGSPDGYFDLNAGTKVIGFSMSSDFKATQMLGAGGNADLNKDEEGNKIYGGGLGASY